MPANKPNLSDFLRQEAKAEAPQTQSAVPQSAPGSSGSQEAQAGSTLSPLQLGRMTKAQLLDHIAELYQRETLAVDSSAAEAMATNLVAENQALSQQIQALEKQVAEKTETIASAHTMLDQLKAQVADHAQLTAELRAKQTRLESLEAQVDTLKSQGKTPAALGAIVSVQQTDCALAGMPSGINQAHWQFASQPTPSLSNEVIGWFD